VLSVLYLGFDDKVHRGQLVIDKDLKKEVDEIFEVALKNRFPIKSIVPMAHPKFRKDQIWSDDLSMAANNSSGFNYRMIEGTKVLSHHACGHAIDINPVQNPYIKGDVVLPPQAKYNPDVAGTLTAEHPMTKAFLARGWEWGGNWNSLRTTSILRSVRETVSDFPALEKR
jgi:peptidoglycan L-alanyl-D-glutamate endopeptidase CwlK